MEKPKPYSDYTFTGFNSFVKSLHLKNISYDILMDENIETIFKKKSEIIDKSSDCISLGKCFQEDTILYFLEFGIHLKENFRTYITFIFDHHPDIEEMLTVSDDIGPITVKHLSKLQEDEVKNSTIQ